MRRALLPVLLALLLLAPAAPAHSGFATEDFSDPAYSFSSWSWPTGVPCETYEERVVQVTWTSPGSPAGPGGGPSHALHGPGAPPATGWHQVFAMKIFRTLRTDPMWLPGNCGLVPPWLSSMGAKFHAGGQGKLPNPADAMDLVLHADSTTLGDYMAASGATLAGGNCWSSFVGAFPVTGPWATCVSPTIPLAGGWEHDLNHGASATNPTLMVLATDFPSVTSTYRFSTAPGPGTPGVPHMDEVEMTLDY